MYSEQKKWKSKETGKRVFVALMSCYCLPLIDTMIYIFCTMILNC